MSSAKDRMLRSITEGEGVVVVVVVVVGCTVSELSTFLAWHLMGIVAFF